MIYDCFMFFNELDILEIRLEELYDVVDQFIICECTKTHSGKNKESLYLKNIDRYKKYSNKIKHIIFNYTNNNSVWTYYDNWKLENYQRQYLSNAIDIKNLNSEDIIITSDVDEIPKQSIVKDIKNNKTNYFFPLSITSQVYYGKLTCKCLEPQDHVEWDGIVIVDGETFKINPNFQFYRQNKNLFKKLKNSGSWHFSFMGGEQSAIDKIESYAHSEHNLDTVKNQVQSRINNCEDLLGRSEFKMIKVEIDNKYPIAILKNLDKYKNII
jgi:beta-1,4-mannosyl-glycoprotein beta-1,4-N-acetylglucosaminyltransferase